MGTPTSGTISFGDVRSVIGAGGQFAMSDIYYNTKDGQRGWDLNTSHNKEWYQKNNDGNCNNGNCACDCNCACDFPTNCVNCLNCYNVNCANCDGRNWLQYNCNCACTYNCNPYGVVTNNCNCNCACACACACDCACQCK